MATIRKRGNAYQIDYFDPTGKRVRKSFKKKKDAVAELGKRVSLIAENRYLDVKKDYKTTFKELLNKYEENFKHQTSYDNWKKFCIENFKMKFGENSLLSGIRYVDIETYQNKLKLKITKQQRIRTDAAVNREMGVLRHILRKAVDWDMMKKSPFDKGKSLQLKENNKRLRYLEEDEVPKLLDECSKHLKPIVKCAINTGMDRGEILSLKWDQIQNGFIYLGKYKTRPNREIPINEDLKAVFKEIRKEKHLRSEYVFTDRKGRKLDCIKRGFMAAVKRAGIKDFRFKDLRHTFASHFVMRGGNMKELQEILGHKTMTMTMRYAHFSKEHIKKAVNLLNGLTASINPDMSQTVTSSDSATSSGQ